MLWVELPAGVDTMKVYTEALKLRINTAPGALFTVKDRYRNCLRLNCGIPWTDTIAKAVETVGQLARQQT